MNVLVERAALDDIANALREIYANDTQYKPSEMADAIRGAASLDLDVEPLEATIKPGYYLPRVGLAGYDRVIVDEDEFDPDDYQLLNRTFTLNGSYKAEDFGYYGFDTVTVAVNTAIVGLDDDGDDAEAYVDNNDHGSGGGSGTSTGTIKTRKLPNRIVITTPPTKTNYIVAEPISTAGMVVKAYYPDGSLYGDVTSQCNIDPIVALTGPGGSEEYSDGDGVNAIKDVANGESIPSNNAFRCSIIKRLALRPQNSTVYLTRYDGRVYFHGYDGRYGVTTDDSGSDPYGFWSSISSSEGNAFANAFSDSNIENYKNFIPVSTKNPALAGTLVRTSGVITVTWNRPGDGKALTDMFNISVNNPPSPISDSGSGGGSNTGNDHPITPHI